MGFFAGNTLRNVLSDIDKDWPPYIQSLALCVSLLRGGLGLNVKDLRKFKGPVVLLSIGPVLCECGFVVVIMKFTLNLPWDLSLAAAFMLSAVSPAIMIALCLDMEKRGYGKERNIQSLVIGVTALDALVSTISNIYLVFGILSAIALASLKGASTWFGDPVVTAGITVPITVIGGSALGVLFGYLLILLKRCHWVVYLFLLSTLSLACLFTSMHYNLAGLSYIAILIWSIISVRSRSPSEIQRISYVMMVGWRVVEVVLFGLVGAALDVQKLQGTTVCYALLAIFIGVLAKFASTLCLSFISTFNFKEKLYIALCRLPKATVQAAIGGYILSRASLVSDETYISYGQDIQTVAAISIMTTTLIGLVIASLAPWLLTVKSIRTVVPMEEVKEDKEMDSLRLVYSEKYYTSQEEDNS